MTDGKYLCACTDLRLKSWRFVVPFIRLSRRILQQAQSTPGNVSANADANFVGLRFQTLTVWKDMKAMQAFVHSEPHRTAVGKFEEWAAQDSRLASWWQDDPNVKWSDALARAKAAGNYPRRTG